MDGSSEDKIAARKRVSQERVSYGRAADFVSESKTPRKRAVRKAVSAKAEYSKGEEARKVVSKQRVETPEPAERKAPTSFQGQRSQTKQRRRQQITALTVVILGVAASAAIGFTDKGQIDVSATIEARNERLRTNTSDAQDVTNSTIEVPVQNTTRHTAATLKGRGTGGTTKTAPAPAPAATSTASSTDQTASSTETFTGTTTEAMVVEGGGG